MKEKLKSCEEKDALLRECGLALDDLLKSKPVMAGLLCGSTTLGNLRAELHEFITHHSGGGV